jgi:hypothetical protein
MYICNTQKFKYNKGYLALPIRLDSDKLPKTLFAENTALSIKTSFHVSLMCIKNVEENTDIENIAAKITNLFCEFIENHEIHFENFTGIFRFTERDEDGRKSLVGMCNIKNLNNFFDKVNTDLELNIPYQPTHVSLYTLNLDEAIGLNSQEDIEAMTKDVSSKLPQEFIDEIMKN